MSTLVMIKIEHVCQGAELWNKIPGQLRVRSITFDEQTWFIVLKVISIIQNYKSYSIKLNATSYKGLETYRACPNHNQNGHKRLQNNLRVKLLGVEPNSPISWSNQSHVFLNNDMVQKLWWILAITMKMNLSYSWWKWTHKNFKHGFTSSVKITNS